MPTKITFERELESLINHHCKENESNTPDFLLAEYIQGCLKVYTEIINKRDKWFDFKPFGRLNFEELGKRLLHRSDLTTKEKPNAS